jgi:hypothetical protein
MKTRDRTIVEQMSAIKRKYPSFTVAIDKISLKAKGVVQPTARSLFYTIEVKYRYQTPPQISILKPALIKNHKGDEIPHIYPGKKLCLFFPKYKEFTFADYISDTIIPWTSLWLYYYEDWHITGEWHGEGIDH